MPLVMLKKNWPGGFRRNVRDKAGKILRTLEFTQGETLDVEPADCAAIAADIGKSLNYCEIRDGKLVVLKPEESVFTAPPAADVCETQKADSVSPETAPVATVSSDDESVELTQPESALDAMIPSQNPAEPRTAKKTK